VLGVTLLEFIKIFGALCARWHV